MKLVAEDAMVGQRFGRLVVHSAQPIRNARRERTWLCICDCGESVVLAGSSLRSGNTRSCGCLRRERATKHATGTASRGDGGRFQGKVP